MYLQYQFNTAMVSQIRKHIQTGLEKSLQSGGVVHCNISLGNFKFFLDSYLHASLPVPGPAAVA